MRKTFFVCEIKTFRRHTCASKIVVSIHGIDVIKMISMILNKCDRIKHYNTTDVHASYFNDI